MRGNEVNELMKPEALANQDENKSLPFLKTKLHVFNLSFHNFETTFLKAVSEQSDNYDFIPFPSGAFVDMLIEASIYFQLDRTKKFLDIGCGPGTKVMLANVLFDAHGIEIKQSSVRMANRLGLKNVSQGDALKYDNYGDFDLLYFYRPFKNDPLQHALEERIFEQMKPGALCAPMHMVMDWDRKATKVSNYWYLKDK